MARKTTSKKSGKTAGGSRTGKSAKAGSASAPADGSANAAVPAALRTFSARRWVRRAMLILLFVIALPFLLTLLYAVPAIHPPSTIMLGRWVTLQGVERQWTDLANMGRNVPQSVLSSEDGQFCMHDGIDWAALNDVIGDALDGEKTRGASTITMQLTKNLFLWPGRSYVRKALEIPLAVYVDLVLTKKRIMEIYLNIAEWDEGVFGAEAAAQHYFGRPAAKLNARQAALLAATLPNPKERNPAKPSRAQRNVASVVERRARKSGAYVKCLFD